MGFLPTGVCVIALLSLFLLGRSFYQLRRHRNDLVRLAGTARLRTAMYGLIAAPPVVLVGLSLFFLFLLRDQSFLRAAHAFLVLGLWMVLTLAFAMMIVITRLGERPTLSILAAAVLSVPLVAYLTPLDRFDDVFRGYNLYIPLATGVIIALVCYFLILIARGVLLKSSPGDSTH